MIPTYVWIIALFVVAAACIFAGYFYRKKVAEKEIGSAEDEAKKIINNAIKTAEAKKRESVVEAREEIFRASRRKRPSTGSMKMSRPRRKSSARS